MGFLRYSVQIVGTLGVLVVGWVILTAGYKFNASRARNPKDQYRRNRFLSTIIFVVGGLTIFGLWAQLFQHTSTFLGIIGAGLAVALREPLLSIAGRVAIFVGHMYTAGDRIEINKMSGDVIDVGFFYTRMMEIGNWISGDQYSGRIIQFANAQIFGSSVFNYTRNFDYIWDEVKLPITYESNVKAATDILKRVGGEYTKEFMQNAEAQIERMQNIFMVPRFEVEPVVYLKVTDNWVELVMRYLVAPKKRRAASSYIYDQVFQKLRGHDDIQIASTTMTVTVERAKVEIAQPEEEEQPRQAA